MSFLIFLYFAFILTKHLFSLSFCNRLEFRVIKGNSGMKRLVFTLDNEEGDDMFYLPGGIMFFKATGGNCS